MGWDGIPHCWPMRKIPSRPVPVPVPVPVPSPLRHSRFLLPSRPSQAMQDLGSYTSRAQPDVWELEFPGVDNPLKALCGPSISTTAIQFITTNSPPLDDGSLFLLPLRHVASLQKPRALCHDALFLSFFLSFFPSFFLSFLLSFFLSPSLHQTSSFVSGPPSGVGNG
ncbi:hypothetical protein K505DRAFT_140325 [Melanomma pulvis-pyrius CBS 109.77]|uniref:Uncharacterized protein n=1 Tax=Melanomma pulvis-pyrius CBS 109.77 TaxID=1314802 RepID=A0A6A6WRX7_9PLEO|nr:hypothetical protein K505DRAFT_140325 [Melanomma pulvis-pyrius CBS 109.77]